MSPGSHHTLYIITEESRTVVMSPSCSHHTLYITTVVSRSVVMSPWTHHTQ